MRKLSRLYRELFPFLLGLLMVLPYFTGCADRKPDNVIMDEVPSSVPFVPTISAPFSFDDPVGDNTGPVDVVNMTLSFDKATGNYTIILTADSANPFRGDFRVNINLFNPDTGTTDPNPSFFQDVVNDFSLTTPTDTLTLTGRNPRLQAWNAGDRVATNSLGGGANPDNSSLFRSSVTGFPIGFLTNEDVIADDAIIAIPGAVIGQGIPRAF